MSRSRKKPFVKDRGMSTKEYWSRIRREWRQQLKHNYSDPDFTLRNPKSIINDYDYCDYWFYVEVSPENKRGLWWSNYRGWNEEDVKKYSRK